MINEFKKFILRGNVVELAVGIAVGAAFTSLVNALVRDFVNPLVSIFYKGEEFSKAHIMIRDVNFPYGDLVNNLISFFIVAAVIFFFVVQPINKLSEIAFRGKDSEGEPARKCPYCLSKVPKEATKCKYCTSNLPKKA